ncbi:hypothetical protein GW17_00062121 [Ensete ventricosum]|nr:hypothetical protein GW17_00062121 [Ensete ventricosum]
MRWDLAGSSLGDSPNESGSSLGTQREIAEKKTEGLVARLPEVVGVCERHQSTDQSRMEKRHKDTPPAEGHGVHTLEE